MPPSKVVSGKQLSKFAKRADEIFMHPGRLDLDWQDIVIRAVKSNTVRGFWRKNKKRRGALRPFREYMRSKKAAILGRLRHIASCEALDSLEGRICTEIRSRLTNVSPKILKPYNKVRKVIDLYIEHIVAMSSELTTDDRKRLVPLLFLPLDSQMFRSEELFSDHDLKSQGLSRSSTYSRVKDSKSYKSLQSKVAQRAAQHSYRLSRTKFHRIYFDLLWNDRWRRKGRNLFELNPSSRRIKTRPKKSI